MNTVLHVPTTPRVRQAEAFLAEASAALLTHWGSTKFREGGTVPFVSSRVAQLLDFICTRFCVWVR